MANNKLLSALGILMLVILSLNLTLVSALKVDLINAPTNVSHDAGTLTFTFNVTNNDLASATNVNLYATTSSGALSFYPASISSIAIGTSQPITATLNYPAYQSTPILITNLYANATEMGVVISSNKVSVPQINILPSSSLTLVKLKDLTNSQNATINITNNGNMVLNNIALTSTGDFLVNLSNSNIATLLPGTSQVIEVSSTVLNNLKIGTNTITLTATSGSTTSSTVILIDGSFCKYGTIGNNLQIETIKDKSTLSDDWKWKPMDDVVIEVKVKNLEDSGDKDIIAKLVFVDKSTGREVSDFVVDTDALEQDASIDEGKSKTLTFNFQVSTDVKESSNYRLYVKVYEDGAESKQCTSDIAMVGDVRDIEIQKETYNSIVKSVNAPTTTSCDSTVDLTARLYNVGNNDDDRVRVIITNSELGLNLYKEVDSLSSGDFQEVSFRFAVPKGAEEKAYKLVFSTKFDYDSDGDRYKKESATEDDYVYYLNVLGNCQKPELVALTPKLNSEARAGENLVIQVDVKNIGKTSIDYTITPASYDSWAELVSVEPATLKLDSGSTKQVIVTLKPTSAGAHTFNINAVYNGQTTEQPVSVNVAEKKGLLSLIGLNNLGSNNTMYLVAGIFALLIILIISLIVKVSKKPSRFSEF
ncbi:MAG: putative S-layer protein [Nanoarchaeota archaeon]|nr:putative S-layer protein [Nanoarchaeota archaeon]